ncbi:PEP-CTERM sorting domain-containing protein [Methylomagnum sp.]
MDGILNTATQRPIPAILRGMLAGAALASAAPGAWASTILVFGQAGAADTITGTQLGPATTISATDAPIQITTIDPSAGVATPLAAFFSLTATSQDSAQLVGGSFVIQPFGGSFTITAGAGGSGTNYLSGVFNDAVFGSGPSLTLSTGTPGGNVTFTSDLIAPASLGLDRAISLGFTNVTPPVGLCGLAPNQTLCGFASNVSGNFSAAIGGGGNGGTLPEPATLALLGLGLLAGGFSRARKARPELVH